MIIAPVRYGALPLPRWLREITHTNVPTRTTIQQTYSPFNVPYMSEGELWNKRNKEVKMSRPMQLQMPACMLSDDHAAVLEME